MISSWILDWLHIYINIRVNNKTIYRCYCLTGISHDKRGTYGYLQNRYNCGLPETKWCHPPTSNSEYAWKLLEAVRCQASSTLPRRNTIGTFYRARGAFCETDYAPFHFPWRESSYSWLLPLRHSNSSFQILLPSLITLNHTLKYSTT